MIQKIMGQLPTHKNYYLKRFFRYPITPYHIVFDIAERCNLKCAYCTYGTFHASGPELSISEICACFTSLLGLGAKLPYVSLTGADPILKEGLDDLIDFLECHRFPWGLITNGTCAPPTTMRKIASSKHLRLLRTSLDGLQENHDMLRGTPGCFKKTIEFITEARKSRHKIRVHFTVTALNVPDILPVAHLAARLGCDEIHYSVISFCRESEKLATEAELMDLFQKKENTSRISLKNEKLLTPDVKQLWQALTSAKKLRSIRVVVTPDLSVSQLHDYFYAEKIQRHLKCVFPWFGVRIDSEGNVYPCHAINLVLGNIRTTPLIDIFNGPAFEEFRSRFDGQTLSVCRRCSYLNGRLNCRTLLARLCDGYH